MVAHHYTCDGSLVADPLSQTATKLYRAAQALQTALGKLPDCPEDATVKTFVELEQDALQVAFGRHPTEQGLLLPLDSRLALARSVEERATDFLALVVASGATPPVGDKPLTKDLASLRESLITLRALITTITPLTVSASGLMEVLRWYMHSIPVEHLQHTLLLRDRLFFAESSSEVVTLCEKLGEAVEESLAGDKSALRNDPLLREGVEHLAAQTLIERAFLS